MNTREKLKNTVLLYLFRLDTINDSNNNTKYVANNNTKYVARSVSNKAQK